MRCIAMPMTILRKYKKMPRGSTSISCASISGADVFLLVATRVSFNPLQMFMFIRNLDRLQRHQTSETCGRVFRGNLEPPLWKPVATSSSRQCLSHLEGADHVS